MAAARQKAHYNNKVAIVALQSGELDHALLALKEMEATIKHKLPPSERLQLAPVAMSNLAYYYFKKGKLPAAAQYMEKAAALEAILAWNSPRLLTDPRGRPHCERPHRAGLADVRVTPDSFSSQKNKNNEKFANRVI